MHRIPPTSSAPLSSFSIFNLSERREKKSPSSLIFPAFCFLIALCFRSGILLAKLTEGGGRGWGQGGREGRREVTEQPECVQQNINIFREKNKRKNLNVHASGCRCVRACARVCVCVSVHACSCRACARPCVCEHVIACMCLRVCLRLPFDCHLNLWHVQPSHEASRQTEEGEGVRGGGVAGQEG